MNDRNNCDGFDGVRRAAFSSPEPPSQAALWTRIEVARCMKDYVKYLGLMIDSNLSWKYHIESICHKISKSIGIIAKIRHYVPRRVLLSIYNSLIVPYITYGVCAWGNCALTFQRKIVNLQKRALHLIYFSKSKEHAVPFFLKSNCLPLPSLYFRDCSYLFNK